MSKMEGIRMTMQDPEWSSFPLEFQLHAIRDYARIVFELSKLQFEALGSLHFGDNPGTFNLGRMTWPKFRADLRSKMPVYDRGPWASTTQYIKASLTDEIQFMQREPDVAADAFGAKLSTHDTVWPLALRVFPECLEKVAGFINEENDPYARGSFVLSHNDLSVWNMLFDPSDGHITGVVDWEMTSTVPLWRLLCFPPWFRDVDIWTQRSPADLESVQSAYLDELDRLGLDSSAINMIKDPEAQSKVEFFTCACSPWIVADELANWMVRSGADARPLDL